MRLRHVFVLCLSMLVTAGAASAATTNALSAFSSALDSLNGYRTSIHLYEVKGSSSENATFAYAYSKPNSITMSVIAGPNAGAVVSWNGGNSATAAQGSGFASMFKKSVALSDPLVTSLRGYSVVDLSFPAILLHAKSVAGTMSESRISLGGKATDQITLNVADPASDNGMTREVLYLDAASHLPVRIDGFTGDTLVRSYTFDSLATS